MTAYDALDLLGCLATQGITLRRFGPRIRIYGTADLALLTLVEQEAAAFTAALAARTGARRVINSARFLSRYASCRSERATPDVLAGD